MATTNGSFGQQDQYKNSTEQYTATSGATEAASGTTNGGGDLSKDEIGWYFVEQYYTTLSRSPEKLHLFYGKRSQFVSGPEAEIAPVSVGRSAIQERIKELDFQDCKVRVSNVDSQASDANIVIQVIGETSNKSADLKKFVQTFILTQQPTGYFVLNDIFRYISEDVEEEVEPQIAQTDAVATAIHDQIAEGVEMPKAQATEDSKTGELDPEIVDKKLADSLAIEPAALTPATNGDNKETPAPEAESAAPAASQAEESSVSVESVEKAVEEEAVKEPEVPKEPVPTPAAVSRTTSTAAAPVVQPAAPPKPMSWANRAAAAAAAANPRPAVPIAKAASPAPTQTRAPPTAQPAAAQQPTPAPTANKENESPQQSGWQTAGSDAKRQNRPQSVSGPLEKEGTMGYVRNVTEGVKAEDLKAALSAFGELVYFDINRSKNCAFVEYASTAGYQAAAAANPHQIAGESIVVEPRRPKSSAYGGSGYNGGRGGVNNRGRGGFEQGRPNSQRGGRGDFGANRGRGGAARGGRGASQPANA